MPCANRWEAVGVDPVGIPLGGYEVRVRELRILFPVIWLLLAGSLTVACQSDQVSPTPTEEPMATAVPPTPAPTRAASTATAVPTKAPQPSATPTRPPAVAVKQAPTAGPSAQNNTFAEGLPPELLPSLMAAMLPEQDPPRGALTVLSPEELGGLWEGWVTIDAVKLAGASPQDQKSCDEQLAAIKGRPMPTGMEFDSRSADSGMVTIINEQDGVGEPANEAVPYSYRNGVLTFEVSDAGSMTVFRGNTLRTDSGFAVAGTWSYEGRMDPESRGSPMVSIEGSWAVTGRTPAGARPPSELEGRWTGEMRITGGTLQGVSAGVQQAFQAELQRSMGQPQSISMTFSPRAGTVKLEAENTTRTVPFQYANGQVTFEFQQEGGEWVFEGNLSKRGSEYSLQGTFKAGGPQGGGTLSLEGRWSVVSFWGLRS